MPETQQKDGGSDTNGNEHAPTRIPVSMQMGAAVVFFGMGGVVFAPLPMRIARVAALSVAFVGLAVVYAVGWLSPGDGFHIDNADTDTDQSGGGET